MKLDSVKRAPREDRPPFSAGSLENPVSALSRGLPPVRWRSRRLTNGDIPRPTRAFRFRRSGGSLRRLRVSPDRGVGEQVRLRLLEHRRRHRGLLMEVDLPSRLRSPGLSDLRHQANALAEGAGAVRQVVGGHGGLCDCSARHSDEPSFHGAKLCQNAA